MDDIINYVMDTPGNINPNVLRGILENNSGGSSGGGLVVHADIDETNPKNIIYTLDKTGQEIIDAYPWVKCVYNHTGLLGSTQYPILDLVEYEVFNNLNGATYSFIFAGEGTNFAVGVTNLNDYPTNRQPEEEDPGTEIAK